MSVAWKCDRCGTYCGATNTHRVETRGRFELEYYEKDYDLCPKCRDELDEFMAGVPAASLVDKLKARLLRKD